MHDKSLDYEIVGKCNSEPDVAMVVILVYPDMIAEAIRDCLRLPGIDYVEVRE